MSYIHIKLEAMGDAQNVRFVLAPNAAGQIQEVTFRVRRTARGIEVIPEGDAEVLQQLAAAADPKYGQFQTILANQDNHLEDAKRAAKELAKALGDVKASNDRLREAIRQHWSMSRGHDMCWENDEKLWQSIGLSTARAEPPPWCEFMQKCAEYRASRDKPAKVTT
jgi:hypothetical protein